MMKIALFEPYGSRFIRGNSIAAARLASGLKTHSVDVRTYSLRDVESKSEILKSVRLFQPQLLHGFHACKTGPLVRTLSKKLDIPYVISLRGTDAYEDAFKSPACKKMSAVLKDSNAVVVFHPFMKKTLLRNFPFAERKISIIPQGVELSASARKIKVSAPPPGSFIFGYAGGLRKLKGILEMIRNLKTVHYRVPDIHFYIAGPVIEKAYALRLLSLIKKHAWITYLGEIPHNRIASFYALLDVFVNASSSEGTSNAVLEAQACGKCVLASDVEGNRAVVKNGKTGVLYSSPDDFLKKALFLIQNTAARRKMGESATLSVKQKHASSREAFRYRALYLLSLKTPAACPPQADLQRG